MSPDKRARLGLFLAFQYPSAIPGVTVASFLRNIYNAVHHPKPADETGETSIKYTGIPLAKFRKLMEEKMALLHMDPGFATRYVNEGFSGGEKKRLEMLQMAVLDPPMAILDETDSGLDIDALRNVADGINATLSPEMGVLMITHYQRMLNYVKPQFVHVLLDGRIVMSGGEELEPPARGERLRLGARAGRASRPASATQASAPEPVEPRISRRRDGRGERRPTRESSTARALRADFPVFERPTRSGPARWPTSTPHPSAQKPRAVIDAVADAYAHHYANVHRGIYELSVDADARFEGARRRRWRGSSARPSDARGRLRAQRDRGAQPRRLQLGARERRRRRPRRLDRDGAPRQPRPVAAAGGRDRRDARARRDHR